MVQQRIWSITFISMRSWSAQITGEINQTIRQ